MTEGCDLYTQSTLVLIDRKILRYKHFLVELEYYGAIIENDLNEYFKFLGALND